MEHYNSAVTRRSAHLCHLSPAGAGLSGVGEASFARVNVVVVGIGFISLDLVVQCCLKVY